MERISVVIATYNGEKYIYDQLESIRLQSRPADEVIISDDNSVDNTVEICLQYIAKYKLDNWNVVKTKNNLGYYGNFMNAIENSSGDVIFLADQDDSWLDSKIEEMTEIMKYNKNILTLASTFSYINKNGLLIKEYEKHPYGNRNQRILIDTYKYFKHPYYLGMSMAIRRSLYERIKYLDNFGLTHDLMFSLYAVRENGFYYYNKVLTKRRLHEDNTSALTSNADKENEFLGKKETSYNLWRKLKHYNIMMQILKNDQNSNDKLIAVLKKFIIFQQNRYNYVDNRKIFQWLKNIFFIKYYKTVFHYFNDFRLLIKKN